MTKAGECSARSPHRNWHSLERVRKTRKHVVDVSSAIDLDTSSDQLLEHDAHFEASQVGSEAVVTSEAKSEMVIRVAGSPRPSLASRCEPIRQIRYSRGIGHSSWVLAQRPSLGVMVNP